MASFLLQRFLQAIPVLLIVMAFTFLLVRLMPGSPFIDERAFNPRVTAELEKKFGLNGPLHEQLGSYLLNLVQGDLGLSTHFMNRPVTEILSQTFPNSVLLGSIAFILAVLSGILIGSFAAAHHNQTEDRAAMMGALVGICLPTFLIAPLFILAFCIYGRLFPVAGWGTPAHFVLPVICLAIPYAAYCARLMRTSMIEELQKDYIRTARAKGIEPTRVIYVHALKNGLLPLVSYSGPLAAHVLTGSIIIEEIFKIPGMGSFFIHGVLNKDPFLVGGVVLIYCTLLVFFNLIADVLYATLDRRIKLW